jgi:hypothetical protein
MPLRTCRMCACKWSQLQLARVGIQNVFYACSLFPYLTCLLLCTRGLQSQYTGVYARGSPTNVDMDPTNLAGLCDR